MKHSFDRSIGKRLNTVLGFLRLKQYSDSLLGIPFLIWLICPEELFSMKTVAVLVANICMTAFGFSFNDIEDAEDDLHDPVKRGRNVIANGSLKKGRAYLICLSLLFMGLAILCLIDPRLTLMASLLSMNSFLYSWKRIRFKSMPFIDLASHAIGIGMQQLLITYSSFQPIDSGILPYLGLVTSFSLATQLSQELRDCRVDEVANINTTARVLGKRNTMISILIFSSMPTLAALLLPKPLPYLAPIMTPAYLLHLNKRLGFPLKELVQAIR